MATIIDFKTVKIDPLREDESNWVTYSAELKNALQARMLVRHALGTARKLAEIVYDPSLKVYMRKGSQVALSDEEADKLLAAEDEYDAKEARVKEIIRMTVSKSLWAAIASGTAVEIYTWLQNRHTNKPTAMIEAVHKQIMAVRHISGAAPHDTIAELVCFKDRLISMGETVRDDVFVSRIRTSFPDY
ncbi:hypothetical protein K488DRAFT_75380, partial [Vararia minispora EC-137]